MKKLTLRLGALVPSIAQQLADQGMRVESVKQLQADADAITRLAVRGIIPASQAHKARQRLVKRVHRELSNGE